MNETRTRPLVAAPAPPPEQVLVHLDSLPALPAIAQKLLPPVGDDRAAAGDVTAIIAGDSALAARIIALANSAAFGARQPVNSLERAVALIGRDAVRGLAVAAKLFDCFPPPAAGHAPRAFDRREFWKHCLAAASAARRFATLLPNPGVDPNVAFIAGLLHDVGKLALDTVYPKAYERIAAAAQRTRSELADCERDVLGVDHTVAGRRVAERWRLPRALQEVIWLHHLAAETLPPSVMARPMIALVQLADAFVREQHIGHSANCAHFERAAHLAGRLGISEVQLGEALPFVVGEVAAAAEWLGLDQAPAKAECVKSLLGANAELNRANAELEHHNQRLAAAARYFRALGAFNRELTSDCDAGGVVCAMAAAAAVALRRDGVCAFGVSDDGGAIDLAWVAGAERGRAHQPITPELREWLDSHRHGLVNPVLRVPPCARSVLAPALRVLGGGEAWVLPVVHDREIAGGIAYLSDSDQTAALADEAEDLRSFLMSLGLALGRTRARDAARRLADDLADTNRRLQQMQLELLRSRTLSMIAEMAAGAGHELNSPLTVISGRAQMMLRTLDDPEHCRSLELIHAKAHECSRIVSELMDFARPRAPQIAAVDLYELFAELRAEWIEQSGASPMQFVIDLPGGSADDAYELEPRVAEVDSALRSSARSSVLTAAALPPIRADRQQIAVVFRELIRNATDAIAAGVGRITVTGRVVLPGEEVEICVRDTGCGMSAAVLERAFDPFFSHRAAGRGRGLGLARAHRIVEAHAGRIWLESRPESGTTAHVVLPAAAT